MYYHDIAFGTQLRFFFISFAAGLIAGMFALILCAKPLKGILRFLCDIVFCLISVLLLICTNIVFQEGALRVYQVLAFIGAMLLVVVILKKYSDKLTMKIVAMIQKYLWQPQKSFFKHIVNNMKKLLKKVQDIVYNSIIKIKEYKKRNAIKESSKKEEKKKAGKTAS